MDLRLEGKRALVTGGNSGIGAAIALALAEAGARVAVNYVSHPEAANGLLRRIKQDQHKTISLPADISDPDAVAEMFQQMDSSWGGIDLLVNNAGIDGDRALSWEADLAKWRRVLEVNLFGTFHCAREALKRMIPRRTGVVVNISSVHEEIPWSGYSGYAASKAAVSMLTKTLAQEAAPFGVRVLAVAPGAIKTTINRSVWSNPQGLEDLLEKIPLHRVGEPEEIARMVLVLVSDLASYVTGRTIFVDGGMTNYPSFAHGG